MENRFSKEVRAFPSALIRNTRKKLAMLHAAKELRDLGRLPGNRLERLKGDHKDFYSMRVNEQWRIVFKFEHGHADAVAVEDYHR